MIHRLKLGRFVWPDVIVHMYLPAVILIAYACATHGSQSSNFSISPTQVAKALCDQGTCVPANRIAISASVVAKENDPDLEVLKTDEFLGDNVGIGQAPKIIWVMLGCRGTSTCIPFYVEVKDPPESLVRVRSSQPEPKAEGQSNEKHAITIRAGTHATLEIVRDRSKIQLQVITVENGRIGDHVRVRVIDNGHVYRATLVSPTLLEETLE